MVVFDSLHAPSNPSEKNTDLSCLQDRIANVVGIVMDEKEHLLLSLRHLEEVIESIQAEFWMEKRGLYRERYRINTSGVQQYFEMLLVVFPELWRARAHCMDEIWTQQLPIIQERFWREYIEPLVRNLYVLIPEKFSAWAPIFGKPTNGEHLFPKIRMQNAFLNGVWQHLEEIQSSDFEERLAEYTHFSVEDYEDLNITKPALKILFSKATWIENLTLKLPFNCWSPDELKEIIGVLPALRSLSFIGVPMDKMDSDQLEALFACFPNILSLQCIQVDVYHPQSDLFSIIKKSFPLLQNLVFKKSSILPEEAWFSSLISFFQDTKLKMVGLPQSLLGIAGDDEKMTKLLESMQTVKILDLWENGWWYNERDSIERLFGERMKMGSVRLSESFQKSQKLTDYENFWKHEMQQREKQLIHRIQAHFSAHTPS